MPSPSQQSLGLKPTRSLTPHPWFQVVSGFQVRCGNRSWGRLGEVLQAVRDVPPLAPGAAFAFAGSAALGSDAQ